MSEAAAKAVAGKPRPKYLNLQALLFEIRLPVTGWVSILHRISSALLFVAMVWRSDRYAAKFGGIVARLRAV